MSTSYETDVRHDEDARTAPLARDPERVPYQEKDAGRGPTDWVRGTPADRPPRGFLDRRRWVETKWSFKTSELLAFVLAGVGILVAAWQTDNLDARRAWLYVTALTIGYMLSRGLAKAGKGTYDDS
jgi:hypothetical protein